jgi:thioredoxin-related protein
MKKLLLNTAFILSAYICSGQVVLPVGSALPKAEIKMKDVSGSLVSLGEAKATNGLLVVYYSNTCPFVAKNLGRLTAISEALTDKNIGVILLNSNEANRNSGEGYADMQAYAKQHGLKWYYVLDSNNELADAFGATRTPECFLFDASGKLVYHGALDDSPADMQKVTREHLKKAMEEMLSGKEVTVKESRSVGCSIHRKKT